MKIQYVAIFCFVWAFPAFANNCESKSRVLFSVSTTAPKSEKAFSRIIALHPVLPKKKQRALFEQYAQTGDASVAHQLVLHNLRIVWKIASVYRESYAGHFMDIVHEGVLGLFEAVEKFDLTRGENSFYFISRDYIKTAIANYLYGHARLIRVKVKPYQQRHFLRLKRDLALKGKSVFEERKWVAKEIGVSADTVSSMDLQLGNNNQVNLEEALNRVSGRPLTDPIFRKHLAKFLKNYSARNRDIFLKRYISPNPTPQKDLARIHNVVTDHIKVIQRKMLRDLKSYVRGFESQWQRQ